jgi:hypothetical protein
MGYAAVMGFMTDNKLTLAQYSWLGSIFCESRISGGRQIYR